MTIPDILSYLFPAGGGATIIALLIGAARKNRAGKMSRAELMNVRADKAEKLAARYLAFIWLLLARWPANHPKPPWPRGLKPKE
jgi:hypothetical protein